MVSLCQDLFGENHIAARQCLIDLSLLLVGHSRRCLDHPRPGKIANDNPGFGRIMTDLNSLIVFAHVVEANSFSGAARILKMPTSTVSRRIAELEDQLGTRLIERSTRRLRLTYAGSEVLE